MSDDQILGLIILAVIGVALALAWSLDHEHGPPPDGDDMDNRAY